MPSYLTHLSRVSWLCMQNKCLASGTTVACVTCIATCGDDFAGGCKVSCVIMLQDADAPVIGVASLPIPHMHQVAIAAVDSQGYVHLYCTPLAAEGDNAPEGASTAALDLSRSAPQGLLQTALAGSTGNRHSSGDVATLEPTLPSGIQMHMSQV